MCLEKRLRCALFLCKSAQRPTTSGVNPNLFTLILPLPSRAVSGQSSVSEEAGGKFEFQNHPLAYKDKKFQLNRGIIVSLAKENNFRP